MLVSDAVITRRSVRGFTDKPVSGDLLRSLLELAGRAPSGGNLQPWRLYVLGGEPLDRFRAAMQEHVERVGVVAEGEYEIYPRQLGSPYFEQRQEAAEMLYSLIKIPREDRGARREWMKENFSFFGAPTGILVFIDRCMGPPQWSDLGMYMMTLMLLLREAGLDSCPQEIWSMHAQKIYDLLGVPRDLMLFAGMAVGYKDPANPANLLQTTRAPLESFAEFRGI